MRRREAVVEALVLCGLLSAGRAAGADKPAPAPPPAKQSSPGVFIETLNINVVNVDVYVTDRQGNRVSGLGKDDFEVYEDGRPMAITNFYAVDGGKPVGDAAPAPEAAPAPGAPGAAPPAPEVPEDQRLNLVIYIDNYNLLPFHRNRVMRELRDFLRQNVGAGDRVMLVTYDRDLHVRRNFTTDADSIAKAMIELETISAQGVHQDSDHDQARQKIDDAQDANEALSYARNYAEALNNDREFTIEAIKQVISGLAGLPGRKAIIYVSDGLEMIAGDDLFQAVQLKFGTTSALTEAFGYDASRRFEELAAAANANRVTFYTIDAGGLRVYSSFGADQQSPSQGATLIDATRISNLQSPLQLIAEKTGGKAILNANDSRPALAKIALDFNTYYSLGYTPAHSGDGRYHRIEVKVKRKGVEARHRDGYRDKSTDSRMADGTLSSLFYSNLQNSLGVKLEFGHETRQQGGLYLVPIQVRIPIGKLTLVPTGEKSEARVRLFVAAADEDGGTSPVQQTPVPISIPNDQVEEARGKDFVYALSLLMRGGEQRVAIGVLDDVASEASFVTTSHHVGTR